MHRAALLTLALWATAAEAAPRRSLRYAMPEDVTEAFRYEVEHRTQTHLLSAAPAVSAYDVAGTFAALDAEPSRWTGQVARTVARVFRDRSLGLLLSFDLPDDDVRGRSVSLRVHASGELLDSVGWDQLLGAPRAGEGLAEAALATIMRLPALPPAAGRPQGQAWVDRIAIDAYASSQRAWVARWLPAEAPEGCVRCAAYGYEATVDERFTDSHPVRLADGTARGDLRGVVVLDRRRRLVEHRWSGSWTRTLTTRDDAGERASVEQLVDTRGVVQAAP